jgi:hypothetical protein
MLNGLGVATAPFVCLRLRPDFGPERSLEQTAEKFGIEPEEPSFCIAAKDRLKHFS